MSPVVVLSFFCEIITSFGDFVFVTFVSCGPKFRVDSVKIDTLCLVQETERLGTKRVGIFSRWTTIPITPVLSGTDILRNSVKSRVSSTNHVSLAPLVGSLWFPLHLVTSTVIPNKVSNERNSQIWERLGNKRKTNLGRHPLYHL